MKKLVITKTIRKAYRELFNMHNLSNKAEKKFLKNQIKLNKSESYLNVISAVVDRVEKSITNPTKRFNKQNINRKEYQKILMLKKTLKREIPVLTREVVKLARVFEKNEEKYLEKADLVNQKIEKMLLNNLDLKSDFLTKKQRYLVDKERTIIFKKLASRNKEKQKITQMICGENLAKSNICANCKK